MTTATANNAKGRFNGFLYSLPTCGFTSLLTHDDPLLLASPGVPQTINVDRQLFDIATGKCTSVVHDVENRIEGVL